MKTAIITSDSSEKHLTGDGHPEQPKRVESIINISALSLISAKSERSKGKFLASLRVGIIIESLISLFKIFKCINIDFTT